MRSKNKFVLTSDKKPAGDQPKAIETLLKGLRKNAQHQTLLGVTALEKHLLQQIS